MQDSDTTIIISSFIRPPELAATVQSLRRLTHEPILIVDDSGGEWRQRITESVQGYRGVTIEFMPYDSGLSAKRNRGVILAETEYAIISDDDIYYQFLDFSLLKTQLSWGLDALANSKGSARTFEFVEPKGQRGWWGWHTAPSGLVSGIETHHMVDNYLFAKRETLLDAQWPEECHVGEHLPWAFEQMIAGLKLARSKGIRCSNLKVRGTSATPEYNSMRCRANHYRQDWCYRNVGQHDIIML